MALLISFSNKISPPLRQQPLFPQSPFSGTVQLLMVGLGVGVGVGTGVGVGVGVATTVGVLGVSLQAPNDSSAKTMRANVRLTRIIRIWTSLNRAATGRLPIEVSDFKRTR
jgi:hypothetical protein